MFHNIANITARVKLMAVLEKYANSWVSGGTLKHWLDTYLVLFLIFCPRISY